MSCSIERYPSAFKASQKILNICRCSFYPIDIEKIIVSCSMANIIIIPETDYQRFRLETNQARPYIAIKDGRTYYKPEHNLYIIVYNDKRPKNRIRFTLAHEFAHIILEHLSDERTEIDRGGLPDFVYYMYEGSANTFAGNFLAPPIIIDEKLSGKPFDPKSVANIFNISEKSARDYRREDYIFWKSLATMTEELSILGRYKRRLYSKRCKKCGFINSIKAAYFCPICGSLTTLLRIGDDIKMGRVYDSIELKTTGEVKECPICKNEEFVKGGAYCMICGKPAINQCTFALADNVPCEYNQCSHDEPLPGNARYCPYCGNKTTFFKEGLLLPYDQVQQEDSCSDTSDELPFF